MKERKRRKRKKNEFNKVKRGKGTGGKISLTCEKYKRKERKRVMRTG